jgi:hypothetical protein
MTVGRMTTRRMTTDRMAAGRARVSWAPVDSEAAASNLERETERAMNITIDVKPGAVKRALALAGGIAVIGGVVAVAHAVPTVFQDGEVLTAAQLNENFADLEERVGTLETDKVVLQTGTVGNSMQDPEWTLDDTGGNVFDIPVTFSPAFSRTPKVLVVLKNVDAGTTATHMSIDASAVSVTRNGMTIRFSDYSDSSIWEANATWIAYVD